MVMSIICKKSRQSRDATTIDHLAQIGVLFTTMSFCLMSLPVMLVHFFFFSSRRRHTRWTGDWSSDVCSSDLIRPDSPAGGYLLEHGVERKEFNSYGARRGNHEVMVRGTFANVRLRNQLVPGSEGTRSGERRVGKEGRSRGAPEHLKKKEKRRM